MKKKGLAMVLALVLLAVCAVSGTLAWLTAKSDTVVNTFTTSDIEVKLEETKGTTVTGGKEFKMIPGYDLEKDPKAWVVAGSEDCYLFVKLDWANNTYTSGETTKNYLTWVIADGWTQLTGVEGVYYRIVKSGDMSSDNGVTKSYPVLKDNKVTVSGDIFHGCKSPEADHHGLCLSALQVRRRGIYRGRSMGERHPLTS